MSMRILGDGGIALVASALAVSCCRDESPSPPTSSPSASVSGPAASASLFDRLAASIPDKGDYRIDVTRASRLVKLSLECVDKEYPNKPDAVVDGDDTVRPPRQLTPAFFGCYDWHSAVHGHWAMVRVLRLYPELAEAGAVREALNRHLTAAKLAAELDHLKLERNRLFERPYGWGWLLRLATELHALQGREARVWESAAQPLATHLSGQMLDYLSRLTVPVRSGTHTNTAFSLVHALDYARAVGDTELASGIEQRARTFYLMDRDCPTAYEPSGEDFLSPCLVEADLMRRILPSHEFLMWLDAFLPPMTSPAFQPLLRPLEVKDRHDPRIVHLVGLALQRAWCMNGVASQLPDPDPRKVIFRRLARLHRHDALEQLFDSGYGGAHWLASFAIYLLTEEGVPPPG